jgi:hypothetical protein
MSGEQGSPGVQQGSSGVEQLPMSDAEMQKYVEMFQANSKYAIAIYDDKFVMAVPVKWFQFLPEGRDEDPLEKLWCWYPKGVKNPITYVDRCPVVERADEKTRKVFQLQVVKRAPKESECALCKWHCIDFRTQI